MQTTVGERGQTSIPAETRKWLHLKPGQKLEWINDEGSARVVPIPDDPIAAFRGSAKGQDPLKILLEERRKDREREDRPRG